MEHRRQPSRQRERCQRIRVERSRVAELAHLRGWVLPGQRKCNQDWMDESLWSDHGLVSTNRRRRSMGIWWQPWSFLELRRHRAARGVYQLQPDLQPECDHHRGERDRIHHRYPQWNSWRWWSERTWSPEPLQVL